MLRRKLQKLQPSINDCVIQYYTVFCEWMTISLKTKCVWEIIKYICKVDRLESSRRKYLIRSIKQEERKGREMPEWIYTLYAYRMNRSDAKSVWPIMKLAREQQRNIKILQRLLFNASLWLSWETSTYTHTLSLMFVNSLHFKDPLGTILWNKMKRCWLSDRGTWKMDSGRC